MIPLVLETCPLPLHIREKVWLDFRFRGEWDDQARRLRDHLARPAPVEAPLPCPYPGMRPFEAADAKYFHGRAAEIDALIALVTAGEREIYLVGPSGSGKSSLIAAGVVPKLAAQPGAAELVVRAMRPGDAPVRRLAECLEAEAPDAAAIATWAARHPGAQLVVFVDQLEELFTVASPAEQAGFAAALGALRAEQRCLLVLAVRADFYAELMQSQLWLDAPRRHVDLPPLRGAALRAAIERPARALDVYLERDLVERLLADAAGAPGVLPLLQETLVQLWSRRRRRRLLTVVEYDALGEGGRSGLAVAISSRADRCLRELEPAQVLIARRLLLRLVSFGEGRPNTRRRQTRAQLAAGESPAELDGVLRHLVAARLVTMDGDRAEDDQVDLCHDVLITAWPSFAAWVETRRADELRRRQLQTSADEWIARGRGAGGLLDDRELATAVAWRRTDAARELGESVEVTALVDASRDAIVRARRHRRRMIASAGAGLLVVAAVIAMLVVFAQRRATDAEDERRKVIDERRKTDDERRKFDDERGKAVHRLGEKYREEARRAIADGSLQRAVPYLVAARARGVDDAGLQMLFRIATMSRAVASLRHGDVVTSASFSADGARVVTASRDRTARLWDAASGALLTSLVHPHSVNYAAVSANGKRMLTISEDDSARVWNVTSTPPTEILLRHAGRINTAVFSADDAMVVTASNDQTAQLWSAATGAPLGPPLRHGAPVMSAAINHDASRIVTTVQGKTAAIWDARTGAQVAPLWRDGWSSLDYPKTHSGLIKSARFSSDGARVVTTSFDRTARVWDAATGKTVTPALEHKGGVEDAVFSPDGARIATVGSDRRVRIWDVAKAAIVEPGFEHPCQVLRVDYSDDGTRILVQGDDKRVRIWEVATGSLVAAIDLESGAKDAAIAPDGTRVVTASADRLARIWNLGPVAPRVLATGRPFYDAVYSPDGARIATTDLRNEFRIWLSSGALELDLTLLLVVMTVAFDLSGQQIAVMRNDGKTQLGPVTAPKRRLPRHVHGEPPEPVGPAAPRDPYIVRRSAGSFSPDGRSFATTGMLRSARIWDIASGQPVTPRLMHDTQVLMVKFSPDGRRVVTASKDGTARVWDARSGALIDRLVHAGGEWVWSAEFSPDGLRIVTTSTDHKLRLWDATSNLLQTTLIGHAGPVHSATFSADSKRLLTPSFDHTARIWDVATGTLAAPPLEHAAEVFGAAFSPDGARVVTVSQELVQVWDTRTGRPLGSPFAHPEFVRSAIFSPDGSSVLTAANDAVRIWDAGLDAGTLDDWRRIARDGSYPQLMEALDRGESAVPVAR